MDTLKSALGLCAKIYEMYGRFTSNKGKCEWLITIVKSIEESLKLQSERDAVPRTLMLPLIQLKEDLQSCEAVIREYGLCGDLKKYALGTKHEEQFQEAGYRLITSHTSFCHQLHIQLVLDERDASSRRESQLTFKVDMILHALQHAAQRDVQQHEEDLSNANEDPALSETLQEFGISSATSTRQRSFAPSTLAPAPTAPEAGAFLSLESARNCSWYVECCFAFALRKYILLIDMDT